MKNRIPNKSIRRSIGTWFVSMYLLISVLCVIVVILSYFNISNYTTNQYKTEITKEIELNFYDTGFSKRSKVIPRLRKINRKNECTNIILANSNDEFYAANRIDLLKQDVIRLNRPFLFQIPARINLMSRGYLISNAKIEMKDDKVRAIMVFEASDYMSNLVKIIQPISICLAIGGVLLLVFGAMKIDEVLKAIRYMTETTKEITAKDLDIRINVNEAAYELKELARTTNDMIDSFQSSYEKQQTFVSDVSHEIKTPISVILGYANMLKRWGLDDRDVLEEGVDSIIEEANNMASLTNRLLLLARYDKNTIDLKYKTINFSMLIEDTLKDFAILNKEITLNKDIESGIYVYGDSLCLKEIVRIFLDNALKYSKEEVNITVSLSKKENKAYLSISDTGVGMSEKGLKNIFDRFYREDKARTRLEGEGGNGLGLSIAREIIFEHRGKITVKTKEQEGSTFTIIFPICKNDE